MMHENEMRVEAVKATLARFEGKPFDWATQGTCIHMMRYHAAQMGHDMPIVPRFRSTLSAKKALKATGHPDIVSLMDSMFERIPPAFMREGDIMAVPGTDGFHALYIRVSVRKWAGWHHTLEQFALVDADMSEAVGAWRL